MNKKNAPMGLGRCERQRSAFDFQHSQASATEVMEGIDNPPSYSGVWAMLRFLEENGHLRHHPGGARYACTPALPPGRAGD